MCQFSNFSLTPYPRVCAWGAAAVAQGYKFDSWPEFDNITEPYPGVTEIVAFCPICHHRDTLESVIVHLNDNECGEEWGIKYTREQIADWVKGQGY